MTSTKPCFLTAAATFLLASLVCSFAAPAPPPAPTLVAPASGASLPQPITLDWDPVTAPGGDIGSYTWQVAKTSSFTSIVASGFTNIDGDPSVPTPTADKVSGLPNGTYFWRVKATQLTINGGGGLARSSAPRFCAAGSAPRPATPSFVTPSNN